MLTPDLLQPVERIDAIVSGTDLGLGFAEELESLAPCGMGNPNPKLLVPGARFKDPRPMGEGRHLRFTVTSGGTRARAVSFGCDGRLGVEAETPVDASFRLELNAYNGAVEPRLLLRHARPCAPEPIDVLGESDHYLAAVFDELDRSLDSPARQRRRRRPRRCSIAAVRARSQCSPTQSPRAAGSLPSARTCTGA